MKKILFYAGLLALATSCAENELDSLTTQKQAKGIVFESASADTKMQWDETETSFVPFWYAEQDRIGLFGLNVTKGTNSLTFLPSKDDPQNSGEYILDDETGNGFDGLGATYKSADAKYKATQSKKNGVFTAINDDETLNFVGDKVARFVAVYPSTVEAKYVNENNKAKIVLSNLPNLKEQKQTTANGCNEAVMMYDLTSAKKENGYDAVGEKVSLSFRRPLSAIVFRTANVDAYTDETSSIFGNLNNIVIETKGYDGNEDGNITSNSADIAATLIAHGENSTAAIEVDTLTKAAKYVAGDSQNESSTVNLTLGMPWKDANLAIAAVKNVDRTAFRQKGVSEAISVKFQFEKIDLESKTKTVSVDFNGFLKFPELDINDYDYLVTKKTNSTRTLIVNKGYFSNIFNNEGHVIWSDSDNKENESSDEVGPNEVAVTEFNEVIVNEDVVLTDAEFEKLNEFTNVTRLTLKGNTEIKESALSALKLEYINMPKVTTIGATPFKADSELKTVLLPSYDFEDLSINPSILKKSTLEILDMSGVKVMNAGFPATGLTLEGYSKLETVTVRDGVRVGANAFKGCTGLTTVNGRVNIEGTAAFKNCTSLETINILNRNIEADVFEGDVLLKNVLYNGKQVAPTAVGVQAFKGCTELVTMDLRNATKIGEQAFMNCKALIGTEKAENNKNVLYVGAEFISEKAFAGCNNLEYVYFINATGFGDMILGDVPVENPATGDENPEEVTGEEETEKVVTNYALKEVKFGTALISDKVATAGSTAFGSSYKTKRVKLFVHLDQDPDMLRDATLILKEAKGSSPAVTITFASITKEDRY